MKNSNQTNNNTLQYLNNVNNYKSLFDVKLKIDNILYVYTYIIKEYIINFYTKMAIKHLKNIDFIFIKGFDTITHVFETTLLYTKNIELTKYHSHKAIFFFIEFTEQITDEQNSFLQLSTKDASLFVYKKTIFEINNEYKRKMPNLNLKEQELLEKLNIFIKIYKLIINNKLFEVFINSNNTINNTDNNIIEKINKLKYKTAKILLNLISLSYDKLYTNKIILDFIICFLKNSNNKEYIEKISNSIYFNNLEECLLML